MGYIAPTRSASLRTEVKDVVTLLVNANLTQKNDRRVSVTYYKILNNVLHKRACHLITAGHMVDGEPQSRPIGKPRTTVVRRPDDVKPPPTALGSLLILSHRTRKPPARTSEVALSGQSGPVAA